MKNDKSLYKYICMCYANRVCAHDKITNNKRKYIQYIQAMNMKNSPPYFTIASCGEVGGEKLG